MNQRLQTLSSLVRPLELKEITNIIILILTPISGIGGFIYWLTAVNANILSGVQFGAWIAISTFLAWALTRELAPDHPLAAFVSVGFAWIGFAATTETIYTTIFVGPAQFNQPPPPVDWLALAALLLYARLINRIVGTPPQFVDSVIVLTATLSLILFDHWLLILIGISAFFIDALVAPRVTRHLFFGLGAIGILIARIAFLGAEVPDLSAATTPILLPVLLMIILITVLYSGAIIAMNNVTSHPDIRALLTDDDPTNDPTPRQYQLSVLRIRLTMGIALSAGLISFFWNGTFGIHWLLPLWAAMAAVGVIALPTILLRRLRDRVKPPKSEATVAANTTPPLAETIDTSNATNSTDFTANQSQSEADPSTDATSEDESASDVPSDNEDKA